MNASNIIGQKYFEGDIVITDPVYFVKDEVPICNVEKPKWEDYFPRLQYTDEMLKDSAILKEYKYCQKFYSQAYNEWVQNQLSDWELCDFGQDMSVIGFENPFVFSTEYGCWSCTVYEGIKEINSFGRFFSDSGLVGVFLLEEIQAYTPDFKIPKNGLPNLTLIPNFMGQIFIVNSTGKSGVDADVRLFGVGNTNFHTIQTGF